MADSLITRAEERLSVSRLGSSMRRETDRDLTVIAELLAEVRRFHTWDGLMSLVDEHYPTGIFPHQAGQPDDSTRDPGPRILSLIREIDRLTPRVITTVEEGGE